MDNFFKEKEEYQRFIIDYLVKENGYIERKYTENKYNPLYAMDTELLIKFIETTQPETIEYLRSLYPNADELIIKRINEDITKRDSSLISKLKSGVYFDNTTHIDLMYDRPATTFSVELMEKYNSNIFSVMEEVYHKEEIVINCKIIM